MYLSPEIAKDIVLNIGKVVDFEICIFDYQGVLVAGKNSSKTVGIDEDISKVIRTDFKLMLDRVTDYSRGVGVGKLLLPVSFDEKVVGVVSVLGLSANVLMFENVIKTIVELAMKGWQESTNNRQSRNNRLIMSIVDPLKYEPAIRDDLLCSLEPESDWVVIVFDLFRKEGGQELTPQLLQQALFSLRSDAEGDVVEVVNSRQLVMLKKIRVGLKGWDSQATVREIEALCKPLLRYSWLDFSVCCGNYYAEIERLSTSYQSAIRSLSIGKRLFPGKKIYCYSDMSLEVLLSSTSSDWTSDHLEKSYENLIYNDKNGCLQKTLKSLFGSNLNMGKTAEELHVHRNTLRYRLGKIQDYTGMDVNNIGNMFFLYSAFTLHRMGRISVA
ncbi:MAG: helix-turn-helix domain-containing protein [Motiliproteus sp.]